mmetsp:Transcript_6681/g.19092  ORF Transcript_6681/g.19092 Transcript_6681/m.19092 type:complete len:134 (+) Transcript_6681:1136-1537(+)
MVTEAQIQNNAIEMVPSRLKGCRKGILRASPPRMNLWIAPSTAKITIVGHVVRLEKDWSASADVVCLGCAGLLDLPLWEKALMHYSLAYLPRWPGDQRVGAELEGPRLAVKASYRVQRCAFHAHPAPEALLKA